MSPWVLNPNIFPMPCPNHPNGASLVPMEERALADAVTPVAMPRAVPMMDLFGLVGSCDNFGR